MKITLSRKRTVGGISLEFEASISLHTGTQRSHVASYLELLWEQLEDQAEKDSE